MAGGAGPVGGDIRLISGEEEEEEEEARELARSVRTLEPSPPPRRRFLSLHQLNSLALLAILSSAGLVAPGDFAFFLFSLLYVYFLSAVAFPGQIPEREPPIFGARHRLLGLYVSLGAALGLVAPVVYIFGGILGGDKEGIGAAAPPLSLLAGQVFMEGLTFAARFSLPVRAFIPVLYNTRRIFAIVDWLEAEAGRAAGERGSARRLHVGRALAAANLLFWGFNLFGFLLPVYLPRAFQRYYGEKRG